MIRKIKKYLKFTICLTLIFGLMAPSYAALSASDGSAFITKAEFDSALADFNARLTTFEAGINSKIDSQVSSYLDRNGIWNGKAADFSPMLAYKLKYQVSYNFPNGRDDNCNFFSLTCSPLWAANNDPRTKDASWFVDGDFDKFQEATYVRHNSSGAPFSVSLLPLFIPSKTGLAFCKIFFVTITRREWRDALNWDMSDSRIPMFFFADLKNPSSAVPVYESWTEGSISSMFNVRLTNAATLSHHFYSESSDYTTESVAGWTHGDKLQYSQWAWGVLFGGTYQFFVSKNNPVHIGFRNRYIYSGTTGDMHGIAWVIPDQVSTQGAQQMYKPEVTIY